MSGKASLSFVIPAYNEEEGIRRCLELLVSALRTWCSDFEILVVDDGSTDATAAVVEQLRGVFPELQLLRHEANRGLGASLRTGFAACRKELVFYGDADLPFDFHELGKALRVLEFTHADAVTGFRHDRTSEGALRIFYSFFYNFMVRLFLRVRLKDINFSFKLFRAGVLQTLDLRSEGSFIDAEMMARLVHRGHRVCQIGIDYFPRHSGRSHLTSLRVILGILREMIVLGPSVLAARRRAR